MKYIIAIFALLAVFLVACDIPPAPVGDTDTTDSDANDSDAVNPIDDESDQTDSQDDTSSQKINVAPEEIPLLEALDITATLGRVGFISPMLTEGQWATYKITPIGTGEDLEFERTYKVVSFFHKSDFCIGIERNSTVPGELTTQTMYCDRGVKRIFIFDEKYHRWDTPQVTGRNSRWGDEAVQGFDATSFDGLERIEVPAGSFWTIPKHYFDGRIVRDKWHSPLVPGFEAGLVKEVESVGGITTTTELVGFGY